MSFEKLEEEVLDINEIRTLLSILNIDLDILIKGIQDARKAGIVVVAVGVPAPSLKVLGLPIILENDSNEVAFYHDDQKLLT